MSRYALVTYRRAGSEWVRDVLFAPAVLARMRGLAAHRTMDQYERLRAFASLSEGTCAGPYFDVSREEWSVRSNAGDRVVHVQRDPRSRLASWVLSVSNDDRSLPYLDALRISMDALDLRNRLSLAINLTGQVAIWIAKSWSEKRFDDTSISTTYERLVADPIEEFRAIFKFFDWHVPENVLRECMAMPRRDAVDWHDYFDRTLGERFERAYPGALVALGYETHDDWFEFLPDSCAMLEDAVSGSAGNDPKILDALRDARRRSAALETGVAAQRALLDQYEALGITSTESV